MTTLESRQTYSLKGIHQTPRELLFDEKELSIQRDTRNYWQFVLIFLGLFLTSLGNTMTSYEKGRVTFFYITLFLALSMLIIFIYQIIVLVKAYSKNKRVYQFDNISKVEIVTLSQKVILQFHFKDNSTDRITVRPDNSYSLFIDFIKNSNIEIAKK